jgi:hypothetical protein
MINGEGPLPYGLCAIRRQVGLHGVRQVGAQADSYVLTGRGLDPLLYLFSILICVGVNDERRPHL